MVEVQIIDVEVKGEAGWFWLPSLSKGLTNRGKRMDDC